METIPKTSAGVEIPSGRRFLLSRIVMELMNGTCKASKFAPEDDVISNMPDNVITNILDRLPLQDAVRTAILSRNWRFKWTMLSQLAFDDNFFEYLSHTIDKNNHRRIIGRLLLHTKGFIDKFVLTVYDVLDAEDINHWILFLSTKGIKAVTLNRRSRDGTPLKLPTHLFSCLELKHLKLIDCCFDPPPTFHGFPNLLSLEFYQVRFGGSDLGEFLTRSPLLEILTLSSTGKVKLVEILKLKNLKMLSLHFCDLDNTSITSSSTIFELLASFPKLQELRLDFENCPLTDGGAKERFSTAFPCVKALRLSNAGMNLSCAFELIRSLPNLQTLAIIACDVNACSLPHVDYNTEGLLQLRRVTFELLKASENELWLIKYLLACSPFLKSIVIFVRSFLPSGETTVFARKLLKFHRASPLVNVELLV